MNFEVYAVFAGTILLMGVGLGILLVIALGIHREEAALSVSSRTRSHLVRGVRSVNGLTARGPGIIPEVRRYRQGLLQVEQESEAA
jgi:hypothetical protein